MAKADGALLGNRAGDGEGLKALADGGGAIGRVFQAALHGNGRAQRIRPHGVFKADGLYALDDGVHVNALGEEHFAAGIETFQTVRRKACLDLRHAAVLTFKLCHNVSPPLLLFARIDILRGIGKAAVGADILFVGFLRILAVTDILHHFAQTHELIADGLAILIDGHLGDIALGELQIAHALGLGGKNGACHAAQALAQILQPRADGQAVVGKGRLAAAVHDLQKQLAHGHVDGVAHKIGIQGLQNRFAGQDLARHSGGMRHARAADGLYQRLFNDALLYVQRQLAGALLRRAPAHAMRQAADVSDLIRLYPLPLLGDGRRAVVRPFRERTHPFYFMRIRHSVMLLL